MKSMKEKLQVKWAIGLVMGLVLLAGLPLLGGCDNNSDDEKAELLLLVHSNEKMGSVAVTPEKALYRKGEKVELAATPVDGFIFQQWQSGTTVLSTEAVMELTMKTDTLISALFASAQTGDDEDLPEFTVEVDWTEAGGVVNVTPETGPYRQGTVLTLEAVPASGWLFKGWGGLTSTANPVQVVVDENLQIAALFEKIPVVSASDLKMVVEGVLQLDDGLWDFEIRLSDASGEVENIDDAVLTVAGFNATKDDFFDGLYVVEGLNLLPGAEVAVVLKYAWIGALSYKLNIPPMFSENNNLQYASNEGVLQLDWEDLDCDGYKFYRRFESSSGSVEADAWPLLTDSELSVTENEIYTSYVSVSLVPPVYFTVWLCPVNLLEPLEGLAPESRFMLIGRRGTRLSNKPA